MKNKLYETPTLVMETIVLQDVVATSFWGGGGSGGSGGSGGTGGFSGITDQSGDSGSFEGEYDIFPTEIIEKV